jgi:hypothetical protein
MLASNRELLAKMTAVGGKRYAPYSMVIPRMKERTLRSRPVAAVRQAKKKFDPNHVLSPEPATFGEYNRAAA